jgi:hypothetical protein
MYFFLLKVSASPKIFPVLRLAIAILFAFFSQSEYKKHSQPKKKGRDKSKVLTLGLSFSRRAENAGKWLPVPSVLFTGRWLLLLQVSAAN